jgi:hypothetical protein
MKKSLEKELENRVLGEPNISTLKTLDGKEAEKRISPLTSGSSPDWGMEHRDFTFMDSEVLAIPQKLPTFLYTPLSRCSAGRSHSRS